MNNFNKEKPMIMHIDPNSAFATTELISAWQPMGVSRIDY